MMIMILIMVIVIIVMLSMNERYVVPGGALGAVFDAALGVALRVLVSGFWYSLYRLGVWPQESGLSSLLAFSCCLQFAPSTAIDTHLTVLS